MKNEQEGIISTKQVRMTSDMRSVEVFAELDAGQALPGMFLHIPINNLLDLTVAIAEVIHQGENRIRLILDCEDEPEIVMGFHFEEETLLVSKDKIKK